MFRYTGTILWNDFTTELFQKEIQNVYVYGIFNDKTKEKC